jgi:hypothetical protein
MSMRGEKRTEFSQKIRKAAFARCCRGCAVEGIENLPGRPQCENCGLELKSGNIVYEHVQPDGLGGEPIAENCKVFCRKICATRKTVEEDNPRMQKADRALKSAYGLRPARQKIQSAPFRKFGPQRSASRPLQRKSDR